MSTKSMKEEKKELCHGNENENLKTALFTAGMLLLLVCLKRAFLLFLIEQWRAWVFLVLNVVLLAIVFTSMNTTSSQAQEVADDEEMEKKKRGNCKWPNEAAEACKENNMNMKSKKRSKSIDEEAMGKPEKEENKINEGPKLSKEELNERVEAFITMFRQHLALDARRGRGREKFYINRKQSDLKHLSSDGINCLFVKVGG